MAVKGNARRVAHDPAARLRELLAGGDGRRPKYARFGGALGQLLDEAAWAPGDCLPTETQLAQDCGLSLGTVQRGIGLLVDQGRLRRVRGRGTFVAQSAKVLGHPFMHLLFEDGAGGTLPLKPRAAAKAHVDETGPWSAPLGQHGNNIFRVDRTVWVDDAFRVLSRFFINADRFPWFTRLPDRELTQGNYKLLLLRELNLPEIAFEQSLEFGPVPAPIARALRLAPGMPACTLGVIARAPDGSPLYYHQMFIPPNAHQLRLPGISLRARRG